MKKLKANIESFKQILKRNLDSEERNHFEIINSLANVFYEANLELKECRLLEERAVIFDLMKTLHPFLIANKKDILEKLNLESKDETDQLKIAFIVFDRETKIYSKYLNKAKKEKINRNKRKYKGL